MKEGKSVKRKLGVSIVFRAKPLIPVVDQMKMIKDAGFDSCFSNYHKDEPIEEWADASAKLNLPIEMLHAPFLNMNDLWLPGLAGEEYLRFLMTRVEGCSRIGVNRCVIHPAFTLSAPPVSPVGLARFKRLCQYAREKEVRLCFENLEGPQHLEALLEDNPTYHGFCWDCGHNYCYTPSLDFAALYPDRILCTHIHDNFGLRSPGNIRSADDLHLLPMDGGMDWQAFAEKIKKANYTGTLTLELSKYGLSGYRDYGSLTMAAFFDEAYQRAQNLAALCSGE